MTSIFILHIKDGKRWWAFTRMALWPASFAAVEGCKFSKLMGSGQGEGFGFWPDFSRYALLMEWESEVHLNRFVESHAYFRQYVKHSNEISQIRAVCYKSHGFWDGKSPFTPGGSPEETARIMILTRASIRTKRLFEFWKKVPATSRAIGHAVGKVFSIGVGEWPWVRQATISVWDSEESVKTFAYNQKDHLDAIKRTRERNWYKEELFARFSVLSFEKL